MASLVAIVLIPPLGALSDRIGRKPLLIAGSIAFAVFAYPLFLLLNTGSLPAAIAAHAALAAIESVFVCASLAAGAELFATRVRSSGYSIGYNLSVAVFGGTAPYVATWLVARTGNEIAPAYYVIAAAVVTLADGADDAGNGGPSAAEVGDRLGNRDSALAHHRSTGLHDEPDSVVAGHRPHHLIGRKVTAATRALSSAPTARSAAWSRRGPDSRRTPA